MASYAVIGLDGRVRGVVSVYDQGVVARPTNPDIGSREFAFETDAVAWLRAI